jgi:selenoprotein W-related protein
LTEEILSHRPTEVHIESWTLIPGKGGVFEFVVNDELLFSKKKMGRHAEPGEIVRLLAEKIAALEALP